MSGSSAFSRAKLSVNVSVAIHPASGREYEEAQSVGHALRLLGELPLTLTLFRRFANLGRFVAPYGVAGRAQDHTVLPGLPVGSRPPAGRAGKTWRSGWPRAGRRPASLALGRHAGGPAHSAAARPDRGTPRAGRRAPVQVLDPLRATGSPVSRDFRDHGGVARRCDPTSPLVFHRDGIPIRRWHTAWRTAWQAAGVPTRFLHDCRRTAARNPPAPDIRRHATLPQSWMQRENWEFETHTLTLESVRVCRSGCRAAARGVPSKRPSLQH